MWQYFGQNLGARGDILTVLLFTGKIIEMVNKNLVETVIPDDYDPITGSKSQWFYFFDCNNATKHEKKALKRVWEDYERWKKNGQIDTKIFRQLELF